VAEITVDIGGVRTAIRSRHAEVAAVVADRYAGFLTEKPADWRIDTGLRPQGLVALEDVVVRGAGDGRLTLERHDFVAALDVPARTGTLALGAVDHVALDTFLRVTYSVALLEAGALLIHAASLGRDGRAWVFPGPSGSGKTTLTRLSPDAMLLSDEISIVRLTDGAAACCHGSPFWGDLGEAGRNAAVPLRAIHFLRHAERHAVTPLGQRRALAALLPNVLFFAAEPALVARVLDVAAGLVERVPCFALGFRPEPTVWEVIRGA
jgi:hypothetical protein